MGEIQLSVTTNPTAQIHPSTTYHQPRAERIPPRHHGKTSIPSQATTTDDTYTPSTRVTAILILPTSMITEIRQVLSATSVSHTCTKVHIPHHSLPLTMKQLHTLHGVIQSGENQNLLNRTIFHHLRITVLSPLLPKDRYLHLTVDNTIHHLTTPRTTNVDPPHNLQLYLNPHDRLPYLQHTYTWNEPTSYRLIITTSLPCQRSGSSSERRRPMLRTTAHDPDLVTALTFPADSIQHQQSILTLATHLLLTVPIVTRQQFWNIIREMDSHRQTLQLILATITLKRYHTVWHTVINEPSATQPVPHLQPYHLATSQNRRDILTPRHRHSKRQRHI